jgi:hypothetical protein
VSVNGDRARAAAAGIANHAPDRAVLAEGEGFYVSLIRGSRWALLAGPFDTQEEAEARELDAVHVARQVDPWADFDAHGTCKAPTRRPGILNAKLGL